MKADEKYLDYFEGKYVFGWAVDDWEAFYQAIDKEIGRDSFENALKEYKENYYDNNIRLVFDNAPIPLNLGGQTEKNRLIATDKPMGVFDFSLASRGMYKVPEYFSQKLADEYPEKFKDYELPSGIVPNNLVKQDGEKFYYEDADGFFDCKIQQKGTRAVDLKLEDAKLKYATRNKKVYLTFRRNRGKVKYVEIYSLFYFTSLSGEVQYAVRHIPVLMVAEYLESIGIKTRIYMTRFVTLSLDWELREKDKNNVPLPLYEMATKKSGYTNALFVQPIIAKEFGQDIDKAFALNISKPSYPPYDDIARNSLKKEVKNRGTLPTRGNPDFSKDTYVEGFERYRNKYLLYNKKGLFKSKELLAEAMILFHDYVIKTRFSNFMARLKEFFPKYQSGNVKEGQMLIDVNINPFFNWWMRLSANNLKNKIELINSLELVKDLKKIEREVQGLVDELKNIIEITPDRKGREFYNGRQTLKEFYDDYGKTILGKSNGYVMTDYLGNLDFKPYIYNLVAEITTYADGEMFPTEKEKQEAKLELVESIFEALENF